MSIFTRERERDQDAVISDLQSELRRTQAKLTAMSIAKSQAEALVAVLKRKASKPPVVPCGDAEEGYECPVPGCYARLDEDYRFCPGCGSELDWRTYIVPHEVERRSHG